MNIKNIRHNLSLISVLSLGLFFSTTQANATEESIVIAKLSDAQVFADFTDELPAVVNYFTSATEEEIISFYQKNYGKMFDSERKRGRLTLKFSQQELSIRVVISQQNRKRQVDVLIQNK